MPKSVSGIFKSKRSKRITIAAIGVLVIAALAAGAVYMLSGRSARDFYFNAESKEFKSYSDLIKKTYANFQESQKPYMTGAYQRRTEVMADMQPGNGDFFGLKNAHEVFDIIKRSKLIVETKRNPSDKTSLTDLTILLEKVPFLDAQVITRDRRLDFSIPVLTPNRYFTLNEDKVDEVYDRFGIPVKPKRTVNMADIANMVKFSDSGMDSVSESYGKFFSGLLGENDVKYGKETEVDIAGKKTVGKEVLISLDSVRTAGLLKELAGKAGSDDALIGLTYSNFADVSGLLDEAGLYRLFDYLSKSGLVVLNDNESAILKDIRAKKDVQGFEEAISKAFDGFDFPQGLKMKLVIDKSGNILDRTVDLLLEDRQSHEKQALKIHTGRSNTILDDCRNRFIDVSVNDSSQYRAEASFTPYATAGDEKGSIKLSFGTSNGGKVVASTDISIETDSTTDKLTLKKNNLIEYNVQMQGDTSPKKGLLKGKINTISWKNNKFKTRNRNTFFTYSADLPTFGIAGLAGAFTLNGEDKLGIEPFTLPEVQAANTVDLNTASKEQLDSVQNEIMASFGAFYITNKPIIDAIFGVGK